MSTYVMSDIHGCYDEMMQMLQLIQFSEADRLIMAGDYIDRGPKSFEMLKWIEKHPQNIILLRGNHDEEFAYCVDLMRIMFEKNELSPTSYEDTKLAYALLKELSDGNNQFVALIDYYGTIGKLIEEYLVCMEQLIKWSLKIRDMPFIFKENIDGRTYVIVHAGYIENLDEVETDEEFGSLTNFYLYARDDAYIYGGIKHGMVVAGHTPTIAEEELPYNDGNVYRVFDEEMDCVFYDIDCGCAYRKVRSNAKLACIRLEDEEVFYV